MKKWMLLVAVFVWHVRFFDGSSGQEVAQIQFLNELSNNPKVIKVIPFAQMRWYGVYWETKE